MRSPGSAAIVLTAILIAQLLPAVPASTGPASRVDDASPLSRDVTFISDKLLSSGEPRGPVAKPCRDLIRQAEGIAVLLDGTCSSAPDSKIVEYRWDYDILVDSGGDGIRDNDIDSRDAIASPTWFDDYATEAELTVVDNNGRSDRATVVIAISNVAPTVPFASAFLDVTLRLRVAGASGADARAIVYRDYGGPSQKPVGALYADRAGGSTSRNNDLGRTSFTARIDLTRPSDLTAVVTFSPFAGVNDLVMGDPHAGGQPWGPNVVSLDLRFTDGTACRLDHTFDVLQGRWNSLEPWVIPLSDLVSAGVPIEFQGTAVDPGTDDLLFVWDWGDGTLTSADGLYDSTRGRDPRASPYEPAAGGPASAAFVDIENHAFPRIGTYRVVLIALDDDGGVSTIVSFRIVIPTSGICG